MKKAILATKVGMTQIFNEDGVLTPVTVLQAGPCVVTQVKTVENDGYSAVQVGFVDKKEKGINKPQKGHFDKAEVSPKRYVREFRFENAEEYTDEDVLLEVGISKYPEVLEFCGDLECYIKDEKIEYKKETMRKLYQ